MRNAINDWLLEYDIPQAGAQPDGGGGPPRSDAWQNPGDPSISNPPPMNMGGDEPEPREEGPPEPEDVSDDPNLPDMPEPDDSIKDFEIWKLNYAQETIKAEPQALLDFMQSWYNRDELQEYQRKFMDDNWSIQGLRLDSNIAQASKQIRKNIREQLDRNNPATSIITHMCQVLDTMPHLNKIFIKMCGYGTTKGELHRRFVAALLGAIEVSSSPNKENIIFNEIEYSVKMPTRMIAQWGDIGLGAWTLREDDPERYLSQPELRRLQEGSPEEKDVLRRRVVLESMAKQFEEQAFIIHCVSDDGTIQAMGWDMANSIRSAYVDGKLIVKTKDSENSEAMIDDTGTIVPIVDLKIYFVRETGSQTADGDPDKEEVEFMEVKYGTLFLTAGLNTIRDAASTMQGIEFKEIPWAGNPSDLKMLKRCIYSTYDLLMRQCV